MVRREARRVSTITAETSLRQAQMRNKSGMSEEQAPGQLFITLGSPPMCNITFVSWISNAAARISGTRGAVSSQARRVDCSRQAIYDQARKVYDAVEDEYSGDPTREQLIRGNQALREENARLWEWVDRARVMKSCPGACSSLIPDLLRIWACRRLVSAVIVLTRRASLGTISRRHGHGIAPRLRGWFRRSVSRPWPQGSGPTR